MGTTFWNLGIPRKRVDTSKCTSLLFAVGGDNGLIGWSRALFSSSSVGGGSETDLRRPSGAERICAIVRHYFHHHHHHH
eukprot:CAMPEP_0167783364 /NCGR_PEP_ID=MMETSP0111_2-20121227/7029_1 /TAXON_ID=91324 /ORGANISM="Lotharella globosa, Strain CCCM811" /LENGTH=78 /DNA_ID=CAMNT_0007674293 /DNA_START=224 /DNA_END=457 /DNA_ORIENTATION=+